MELNPSDELSLPLDSDSGTVWPYVNSLNSGFKQLIQVWVNVLGTAVNKVE